MKPLPEPLRKPAKALALQAPGARQSGLTLLEVLVAFSIMAMSMGLLYQAMGSNVRHTADMAEREKAALLAESLLAMHELVPPQGVNESGQSAAYQWTLRSVPYPTPLNAQNPAAAALHELQVSVRWGQDAPRELTLSTLRPQRLLQPGERLR